jgi:hypothetical protein
MDVGTFIVAFFCAVEDWLEGRKSVGRGNEKLHKMHSPVSLPFSRRIAQGCDELTAYPERPRSARHARFRSPPERKASLRSTNAFVTPPEATSKPRAPEMPRRPA